MPLYEYECMNCGNIIECFHSMRYKQLTEYCSKCKDIQPVKKLISKSNFKLEGEGWAKDGYSKQRMEKFDKYIKE